MSELTLYTNTISRGNTVELFLNMLAVPFKRVELSYGEQMNSAEYLAINPMAKVPALVDGDNIVTETAAICMYLADKFIEKGFAPAFGSPERAAYYRWFFFTAGPIEAAFTVKELGIELNEEQQKSSGFGSFKRAFHGLETGLANAKPYICGKNLTAVDVYVGYFLIFLCKYARIQPTPLINQYLDSLALNKEIKQLLEGFDLK
ncbi:glutathione S-transferase [Proteus hauseri ATCC 700826]|uniref:Glutathione S-transferase n=1 Tax=Proteus hauseri ATCC 700826 TaxID=1354271 RepID=A0AAJ3LTD4_PROHU|nr:glutathione S-transferase family protein [Proteus hauseri]OAT46395.1 glutathione S-transferase [Proteus hauseri ATCC 700826]